MDIWLSWFDVEDFVRFLHLGGIVKENAKALLRSSSIVDNFRVLPWILSFTAVVSTTLPSPV